ncbi:MAG: hypothetical protein V7L23_22345 [Nostoc sp.]|uniref:hypothetical protein n=1 Tax=Nostoc sp. TaxID=1180 RepID=UPI002FF20AC8
MGIGDWGTSSVKARDAMNRRLYNNQSFILMAIYRVFVISNFHQKILAEPYWFPIPNPQSLIPNPKCQLGNV